MSPSKLGATLQSQCKHDGLISRISGHLVAVFLSARLAVIGASKSSTTRRTGHVRIYGNAESINCIQGQPC